MCGIFGIAFLKGNNVSNVRDVTKLVRGLFKRVESRGKKASGLALVSPREIDVLKAPVSGSVFIETPEFAQLMNKKLRVEQRHLEVERTTFIIGHCRFDTKGAPENNDNNHPIVVGTTVGVHNGVIINDDDVYDTFKYTARFPKRIAEVDSEIIFALIDYYHTKMSYTLVEAIRAVHKELTGGFACATVNTSNPYLMGLFKKSNPISVIHLVKADVIVFASEFFMATEAVKEVNLGSYREIAMGLDEIMLVNVHENEYSIHPLSNSDGGFHNAYS
ncbi:MAG: hypothetical protein DRO87_07780 [Candidatus Thorarchaeota archaeon]|nr:MAG: hypothetical protein DRO87_07780 [Candidatus Thorarchaeota archaeon]